MCIRDRSDAIQKKIDKFYELYSGPYRIHRILGDATYELVDCEDENKVQGKFNIRQIKKYHEMCIRDSHNTIHYYNLNSNGY